MSPTPTHEQFPDLGLSDWQLSDTELVGRFMAASYAAAGRLAARISQIADEHDHHPRIEISYPGVVQVVTSSHDTGGVTERDVALARAISEAAAGEEP